MAINREQFQALVKKLEAEAAKNPSGYRWRVGLLASMGYAYLLIILALLLGLLGVLILGFINGSFRSGASFKFVLIGGVLLLMILRALWVKLPPPDGLELRREEAPELFQMVDDLTTRLQAPRFHHILLDGDYNAAVAQRSKLGILGWQVNYLLIGLPLMQSLSPEQFRAVIAHEFGHLSGNHGRFGGWIYRIRQTWDQLMTAFEESQQWGSFLFTKFFNWYAPYFSAYSFVLARANEYTADRCAVEMVGARHAAEALIRTEVEGRRLESRIWPDIYQSAKDQPAPPVTAFSRVTQEIKQGPPSEDAAKWLRMALKTETGYTDTHPSLSDRLNAIGQLPDETGSLSPDTLSQLLPKRIEVSAAEAYLGERLEALTAMLNEEWHGNISEIWQLQHERAKETLRSLEELERKAQQNSLTEEEAWNRIGWALEFKGNAPALPLLQAFVDAHPEHVAAQFTLGRALLEENDPAGITHIEAAMEKEPRLYLDGCEALHRFYRLNERDEDAAQCRRRAESHYDLLELAQMERATLTPKDALLPHGLPEAEVQALARQLAGYEMIQSAYLARKAVTHFPEWPIYVLGVELDRPWYKFQSETADVEIVQRLTQEIEFPGETFVLPLTGEFKWLRKALQELDDSHIYSNQ